MFKNTKTKCKGYMLLAAAMASIVYMMLAASFSVLYSGQFSFIETGKTASQAQRYAEIDVNTLTLTPYDELVAQSRQAIDDIVGADGWQDEIVLGPEKTIGEDNKQRIGTVNIYKNGDTLPRYSLQVPLSSQDSDIFPKGTILPYSGDLSKLPHSWQLCDGKNGNPDLRGRFLIGAGSFSDPYGTINYSLGEYGGERLHQLTIAELATHNHTNDPVFNKFSFRSTDIGWSSPAGWDAPQDWEIGGSGFNSDLWERARIKDAGENRPHENQPPFFVIYWIIKKS